MTTYRIRTHSGTWSVTVSDLWHSLSAATSRLRNLVLGNAPRLRGESIDQGQYRGISENLLLVRNGALHHCLIFTSPAAGHGTSTTLLGTAKALAHSGLKVLVVDAHMERASLHRLLGLLRAPGLVDLASGALPEEVVQMTDDSRLAGICTGLPGKGQGRGLPPGWWEALRPVMTAWDVVCVDAPPCSESTEAIRAAGALGSVVLVVDPRRTRREALRALVDRMRAHRADVAGVILNRFRTYVPHPLMPGV